MNITDIKVGACIYLADHRSMDFRLTDHMIYPKISHLYKNKAIHRKRKNSSYYIASNACSQLYAATQFSSVGEH